MSDRPPMHVILAGPAAVAGWLAAEDAKNKASASVMVDHLKAMMKATHLDGSRKLTLRDIAEIEAAAVQLAVTIAYAAGGAMRGPSRDGLSELIDTAFDLLDKGESEFPEFAATIDKIRKAAT